MNISVCFPKNSSKYIQSYYKAVQAIIFEMSTVNSWTSLQHQVRVFFYFIRINKAYKHFFLWKLQGTFLEVYDKSTISTCFHGNKNGVHAVYSNEYAMKILKDFLFFYCLVISMAKILFRKKLRCIMLKKNACSSTDAFRYKQKAIKHIQILISILH